MHKPIQLSLALLLTIFSASSAHAIPQMLNYQGMMTDSNGIPLDGPFDIVQFKIWDDSIGGNSVWIEEHTDFSVTSGLFNVLLGSVTPIPESVFSGADRWLSVGLDGGIVEQAPRARLVAVAYAFRPGTVDGATGGTIQSDLDVDGDLRATGMATIGPGHSATGIFAMIAGSGNTVSDSFPVVSGGSANTADQPYAVVSGGLGNMASGGRYPTVSGGLQNQASGFAATISGGENNMAIGLETTVGGGGFNSALAPGATVGGGVGNTALGSEIAAGASIGSVIDHLRLIRHTGEAAQFTGFSTVAGGLDNDAVGHVTFVGGGEANVASGGYAVIPGGINNRASGDFSFAAGRRAKADSSGSFVWADGNDFDFASVATNELAVRATGGVRIVSAIDIAGVPASGVVLAAGSGSWSALSDKNAKTNIVEIDTDQLMARLAQLDVLQWSYKSQSSNVVHMGPMAQEFYNAFGLGEDERYISQVDITGVTLAAVKCLQEQNQALQIQNERLETRLKKLEESLNRLTQLADVARH